MKGFVGMERVSAWCKENELKEKFKEQPKSEFLKPPKTIDVQTNHQNTNQNSKAIPSKNKSGPPPNSFKKQQYKKSKTTPSGSNNEIDDIFGGL